MRTSVWLAVSLFNARSLNPSLLRDLVVLPVFCYKAVVSLPNDTAYDPMAAVKLDCLHQL